MTEINPGLTERDIIGSAAQRPVLTDLSPELKKRLGGQEQMPQPDMDFFNKLSEEYGIDRRKIPEVQPKKFDRGSFFSAIDEIKTYATQLREGDGDAREVPFEATADLTTRPGRAALGRYAEAERARSSTKRISDIVYLYLHSPNVRKVYSQIHAEKMAEALPQFSQRLSGLNQPFDNVHSYVDTAITEMQESMRAAVVARNNPRDDDMGFITGLEEYEYIRPESLRKEDFATTGIELFGAITEEVVSEAVTNGEDIQKKVKSEFLRRDGLAFKLMRVPLRSLSDARGALKNIASIDLSEAGEQIDGEKFDNGACPAILRMPTSDGKEIARPIAYEFAATVVNNMPTQLAA